MRSVGLITEYNPFHNGHLYHLEESKKAAGAEVAVAVMSGHFLQRGEPALVDKWVRAEMALRAGVDVVIELPFAWACNSAPHFATGAVQALNALGCVDALCFGSESGDLKALEGCARLLLEQEDEVLRRTSQLLRAGKNYPEARALVAEELSNDKAIAELLASPNNILGIEYLKALVKTASPIRPLTIRRTGAGYHETRAVDKIASATGIRNMLEEGQQVDPYIPASAYEPLRQALDEGRCCDAGHLHRLLLSRIFRGADSLVGLYQAENGIERRLFEAAEASSDLEGLINAVKCRHHTRTRIQRILCYVLNEVRSEQLAEYLEAGPLYLHLLACSSQKGRAFLAACRKRRTLPLVQNYSRVVPTLKRFYGRDSNRFRLAQAMLQLELRATCNYTLLMKSWPGGRRNRDFFQELIVDAQ